MCEAAVLAIIVQATVTTVRFAEREDSYQTASAPAEGATVAVRFAPQASMADVGKFLDAYAASLAGGPQPGNLYRLRIGDAALPADELTRIADRMAHEIGNAMVPLSTHQQLIAEKFDDEEFRESLDLAMGEGVKRVSVFDHLPVLDISNTHLIFEGG